MSEDPLPFMDAHRAERRQLREEAAGRRQQAGEDRIDVAARRTVGFIEAAVGLFIIAMVVVALVWLLL